MFGKTKESSDTDERAQLDDTIGEFFGDEDAVAEAARVDHLHQRVTQVEQQISSQFTSLAAYAQIAQEQVELVRSEAQHSNERSEQRVIGLIERERADRLSSEPGGANEVTARLDSLDAQVAEIRDGLQQCLSNQKALADAITHLFAPAEESNVVPATTADAHDDVPVSTGASNPAPFAAPSVSSAPDSHTADAMPVPPPVAPPSTDVATDHSALAPVETATHLLDGPIDGLSLA